MPRPAATEQDFYADAEIYDVLHAPGTEREVAALLRLCRRFVAPAPAAAGDPKPTLSFLEPACGTGRYLHALAAKGHRVAGFDREPGMVRYCRARLARCKARASIFRADMSGFAGPGSPVRPGSIDVAFTPINSIRHLTSDRAMLAHFRHIARVLRSGGVYVVGLHITDYGLEEPSEDVWSGRRSDRHVRQVVQYLPAPGGRGPRARHERVISHLTVRTGRATREIDSAYILRSYDLPQWQRLLARSALRVEAVVDEQGKDLRLAPPGYGIFVLRPRT